jgi:hypothetical protein
MLVDNKEHRTAYILGHGAVRCGNIKMNLFPLNPYDNETEKDLFTYWDLGFEDAYADELGYLNLLDNIDQHQ